MATGDSREGRATAREPSPADKPPATVRLGAPTFGPEELARVAAVLESGWVAGQGPVGAELEAAFSARVGAKHTIAVSNCTAALHLCLLALRVGPGDEVIVADYTFPATGHAVLFVRAEPVFVDVRRDTFTLDVERVAAAVTPRTRGIIAVDAFGCPADYAELEALAAERGLFLLEDAAAGAGATYRGRAAGRFGRASCFSLHGRKGITSGEGGLVTTDDDAVAAQVRAQSAFGIESAFTRQARGELTIPSFTSIGYNYKLSDVQAALAIVQLGRLDGLLARRRAVAARYRELLSDVEELTLPVVPDDRQSAWQSYVVHVAAPLERDRLALALRERGVQANFGTYASHLLPVYGARPACPVSAELFRRQLAIPMHANLEPEELLRVARELREAVAAERRRTRA
ncbi:MAG: DegT/DnrJ/EryC1/StrS family aminotransferase [Myxococcales bacterium]|nr:DegT/DnrJ/EryC1/StrS family aminotransferase [Myxococcales bacterium]